MANTSNPGLYELGVVVKAHGTNGGFLLEASSPEIPLKEEDVIYIRHPESQWVPYRINDIRLQNDRKRILFFVKLEGIQSRTEAESLREKRVMTDRLLEAPEQEVSIIGYQVCRDDHSLVGSVMDVIQTPANDILVVQTDEKDILIPQVDEYVKATDKELKQIIVKNISDLETL